LDQAIKATAAENLFLITAGTVPPNPAELLGSPKMHDLLRQLTKEFEFVFVDSSPVLAVSDSVFLSTMVDGTLLVVSSKTPKPLVKKARARLSMPQSKIVGMLLNRVDVHNHEYSGYYQQYYGYHGDDLQSRPNGAASFRRSNAPASQGNGNGAPNHGTAGHSSTDTELQESSNGVASKLTKAWGRIAPAATRKQNPAVAALSDGLAELPVEEVSDGSKMVKQKLELRNNSERVSETKLNGKNAAHVEKPGATASSKNNGSGLISALESAKEISQPAIANGTHAALPREFITALEQSFLRAMGPMAPIIVREQLRALDALASSPPKVNAERLTKELGKEISDDYQREQFERELAAEIRKLGWSSTSKLDKYIPDGRESVEPKPEKQSRDTREFLRIISGKLGDAMGPIAPLILRERIAGLGKSPDSFPEADIDELIDQVGSEIPSESARRQFGKEMAKELRMFKEQGAANGKGRRAGKRRGAKSDEA